jgi:hypothetical protein
VIFVWASGLLMSRISNAVNVIFADSDFMS